MKSVIRFALFICLFIMKTSSGQISDWPSVVPGKSVAGVSLGETLSSFERLFPKKQNTDEDLPENDCGVGGYHWVDVDRGTTGIYAYTKSDEIIQFSVKTPRFYLPNGIRTSATEGEVRHAYPQGRAYVLAALIFAF